MPKRAQVAAMSEVWLRRLKTERDQEEWADASTPGLAVRVYSSGAKTFLFRYRNRAGARKRVALGAYPALGLADARELARLEGGNVARGLDPSADRRSGARVETFGALVEFYLEGARKAKRSWPEDERILQGKDLRPWHGLPVVEVRKAEIVRVLRKIADRAPIKANRTRAVLSKVLGLAVELEILEHNPVAGTRPLARERKRERVLSAEEIKALWPEWTATTMGAVFRVLLLTGQREGEVLGMRWEDLVAGETWVLQGEKVKNAREHRVHLAASVREILAALPRSSKWVFESPRLPGTHIVSINKMGRAFAERAGVPGWHPHDLRRTAATGMATLKVDERIIERVLNHSPRGVTASVYNRASYAEEMAEAWERWAAHVEKLIRPEVDLPAPTESHPPASGESIARLEGSRRG